MRTVILRADAVLNHMAGPILVTVTPANVIVGQRTCPHHLRACIVVVRMFHSNLAVFEDITHQSLA